MYSSNRSFGIFLVNGLLGFDRNTWNHIKVYKLSVLKMVNKRLKNAYYFILHLFAKERVRCLITPKTLSCCKIKDSEHRIYVDRCMLFSRTLVWCETQTAKSWIWTESFKPVLFDRIYNISQSFNEIVWNG